MATLIPTLNATSEADFVRRARLLRAFVSVVQVDIADGSVGAPANWADPDVAARELAGVSLEIHLMVARAAAAWDQWRAVGPARAIIHVEAEDAGTIMSAIRQSGCRPGIALGPETPVGAVLPYVSEVDLVLFVSVPPGRSGQAFDPATMERIRILKRREPSVPVGVDGGVTERRVPELLAAGVDVVYVGSAIADATDPRAAFEMFRRLVEGGH